MPARGHKLRGRHRCCCSWSTDLPVRLLHGCVAVALAAPRAGVVRLVLPPSGVSTYTQRRPRRRPRLPPKAGSSATTSAAPLRSAELPRRLLDPRTSPDAGEHRRLEHGRRPRASSRSTPTRCQVIGLGAVPAAPRRRGQGNADALRDGPGAAGRPSASMSALLSNATRCRYRRRRSSPGPMAWSAGGRASRTTDRRTSGRRQSLWLATTRPRSSRCSTASASPTVSGHWRRRGQRIPLPRRLTFALDARHELRDRVDEARPDHDGEVVACFLEDEQPCAGHQRGRALAA